MSDIHVRPAAGSPSTSLVLYGVMPAGETIPEGLKGLGDHPVQVAESAGLLAVYSASPGKKVRPERRHLSAHQHVVQTLARQGTVLPVAFGMLFPSVARLAALLGEHAEAFIEQAEHIQGRVEMTVRVSITEENVFQHFVERSGDLERLRDRIAAGGAGHDLKMQAGRLFEDLLGARRDEATYMVDTLLEPVSAEIAPATLRLEKELVHAACLVERGRVEEFEAAVMKAAELFDDSHTFALSGPWPAHSFVSLRLSSEGSDSLQGAT